MASGWAQRADSGGIGWRGFVRLDNGTKRSKTFRLKRDADDWWREQVRTIKRGEFVDPHSGRTTYGYWHGVFVANEMALRASTLARDDSVFRNHILPTWRDVSLDQITHHGVKTWIAKVARGDIKPSTIAKIYQVFAKSMHAAVLAGLIPRSPCHDIRLPEIVDDEMRFLTPAELAALANTITSWHSTMIVVAGYTGLRFGELAGLRRHRVNIDKRYIDVRDITVEVGGRLIFGPPKTKAGQRRVPIPEPVAAMLERHCTERDVGQRELVFHGRQGGALRARAWRARHFVPAVERAGLAPLRPHDLRHTAIAIWIAAGVDPKQIARRAGHTSVAVVLDRYGHLFPDSEQQFGDAVGKLYVAPTAPSSTDAG